MTNEDSQAMPNVAQIRAKATRVIRGRIPAQDGDATLGRA